MLTDSLYSGHAVIWWTRAILLICAAFRKRSVVPGVVMLASTSANVQTLPSKRPPRTLNNVIMICRPFNDPSPYCFVYTLVFALQS